MIPVAIEAYEPTPRSDNNPSYLPVPGYETDPANGYRKSNPGGTERFSFTELVGKGECVNAPDCIVQTADGVSSSKGKDKGRQYTWGNGDAGVWNDTDFDNGNLTGM